MVRAYIYYRTFITKNYLTYHLKALNKVLQKLEEVGLKLKAERSFFRCTETEYLGFWVSKNGIIPLASQLESVKAIGDSTKLCDGHRLIGHVLYYRDMCHNHAHTIYPLTKICSTKVRFKWTE